MRSNFIFIISILLIIIACIFTVLYSNSKKKVAQNQTNKEFEQYINKELYGTDVITLINKASNNNDIYNIPKDENQNYIPNEENSITIDLVMITNEEQEKTKTYRMEKINKVGINEFIKNFNTAKFMITQTQYHKKSGKIKYIQISQQNN